MKKLIVIALAVVMTFAVVAFAACETSETVTGECKYENKWNAGSYYGAKVDVTVKGGVITAVKLYSEEETGWTRTSGNWTAGQNEGDLGHDAAEAAYTEWINKVFVGKTVEEVNAYVASATVDGQTVGTAAANLAGATQSAARIIVAVKNALSKVGK